MTNTIKESHEVGCFWREWTAKLKDVEIDQLF